VRRFLAEQESLTIKLLIVTAFVLDAVAVLYFVR
jgi:hypothetical protein